jgi:hypothetical protein
MPQVVGNGGYVILDKNNEKNSNKIYQFAI